MQRVLAKALYITPWNCAKQFQSWEESKYILYKDSLFDFALFILDFGSETLSTFLTHEDDMATSVPLHVV